MRHKLIFMGLLVLAFASCKSKKVLTGGTINENLSAKAIIRGHYNNQLDFKTLSGRMKIEYSDGESSQGFSVSLRMERDKAIWISAPLGIVKAYITPNRVSFYNKLQNEYFDGDFTYLSNILGTDLDFEKVQNVLLGQALFNLRDGKYNAGTSSANYVLRPKKQEELFKTLFQIEPRNFKMATQQLSQPNEDRFLEIAYKDYQEISEKIVPNDIGIVAVNGSLTNTIEITYKNIEFGKALRFPYKIPKGFKKIVLK